MASERVVILNGADRVTYYEELQASAAFTPGHLLEISAGKFQKHSTSAGNAAPWIALERDELGNDIDVDYAVNDYVKAGFCPPGTIVNLWIDSGQNLSKGDYVESAGNGTVEVLTTDAATDDTQRVSVVGMSLEATGAVTVLTRCAIIIV